MKFSKWMLSMLVAVLVLSFGVGNPEILAGSLKDMKDEKKSLEQKKDNLNGNIKIKEEQITTQSSKVDQIQKKINEINAQVEDTNNKIIVLKGEIDETVAEVEKLQASIVDLEKKIEERDEVLRERVRAMQSNGGSISYLDVLLGANSFSDFIDRITAVNTLVDADRQIMQEQADDQKQLEEEKKLVENKLADLESDKEELEGLRASLQSQKAEQDQLVASLKAELEKLSAEKSNLETELHEVHEVSAELTKEIESEEARLAEIARKAEIERKKQEQANNSSNGSTGSGPVVSDGTWTRPTTGRVSSEFGYRNISFASKQHRGIDIANPIGTAVVAAGDGVVSRTGNLGTYGNVIMVTHSVNGKIYTTLYAHLSSIHVSTGQSVSKGQTIGQIGITGRTSGPHLHFEFHIGGWKGSGPSAVNPRNYVPI